MFCFEHNEKTHKVTKVSGKEDNLGQSVAGTIFHVLNNEKEIIKVSASKIHEWCQQIQPDTFDKLLDSIQQEESKRINQIGGGGDKDFAHVPDELDIPDDPSSKWDNIYLI
jgi:uncharacterized damage-inducible protein DinB